MLQSLKILNVLIFLHLKQVFWKRKFFFKELYYRPFVEPTAVENAILPYNTEANVKTNRMESAKWTYHKEQSFATQYGSLSS